MKTEYEAQFLDVAIDDIRTRLRSTGAVLEKPMRLMRRVTIENDDLLQQACSINHFKNQDAKRGWREM